MNLEAKQTGKQSAGNRMSVSPSSLATPQAERPAASPGKSQAKSHLMVKKSSRPNFHPAGVKISPTRQFFVTTDSL